MALLITAVVLFSGCIAPGGRYLHAWLLHPPLITNETVDVTIRINAGARNIDTSKATFRDVVVIGYNDTKEHYYPNSPTQWSIMRAGWEQNSIFTYNGSSYYTYSIEELATIKSP
jgi:hypothetical protein